MATVVAMLAEGMTAEDILAAYPDLQAGDIQDAQEYGTGTTGPGPTLEPVPTVEQPRDPRLHVYPPEEALKSARPLPRREDLVISDVPDDEWAAFLEVLAET